MTSFQLCAIYVALGALTLSVVTLTVGLLAWHGALRPRGPAHGWAAASLFVPFAAGWLVFAAAFFPGSWDEPALVAGSYALLSVEVVWASVLLVIAHRRGRSMHRTPDVLS